MHRFAAGLPAPVELIVGLVLLAQLLVANWARIRIIRVGPPWHVGTVVVANVRRRAKGQRLAPRRVCRPRPHFDKRLELTIDER